MDSGQVYSVCAIAVLVIAIVTFPVLLVIPAPYGRHRRRGWGPAMNARAAWIIMESPATLLFAYVFFIGEHALDLVPLILFALWQAHYFQRTFIFPFIMRMEGKKDPLLTVAIAIVFNVCNATINAMAISHIREYEISWLWDPRFITGAILFVGGYAINRHSDGVLRRLRAPGESGYKVPRGGFYRWISCPNYFGELIEWLGWAVLTWSLAGTLFFAFAVANLLPRALSHHKWYRGQFDEYPKQRKALIPFIL